MDPLLGTTITQSSSPGEPICLINILLVLQDLKRACVGSVVTALVAENDDLRYSPRTITVRENWHLEAVLWPPPPCCDTYAMAQDWSPGINKHTP